MLKIISNFFIALIISISSFFGFNTAKEKPPEIVAPSTQVSTTTAVQKTSATSTSEKPKETVSEKQNVSITQTKPIETIPVTIQEPIVKTVEFDKINEETRLALVNILCTVNHNSLNPISGSGVVIDPKGVILTNAHIGQYFLLDDFVDCTIRAGSPAYPKYKSKLLYVSPSWVFENAPKIIEANPLGTGQNDFALLYIEKTISSDTSLRESFPFLPINTNNPSLNDPVLIDAYPAGFLGTGSILRDLYITSAITKINHLFTFGTQTLDLISIPGTVLSQHGSSGGAIVDAEGKLTGIVVTSSNEDQTSDRDLRAITTAYINRRIYEETGNDLSFWLSQDIPKESFDFRKNKAPLLKEALIKAIERK